MSPIGCHSKCSCFDFAFNGLFNYFYALLFRSRFAFLNLPKAFSSDILLYLFQI